MADYSWLNRKTSHSVSSLKLWPDNPRLNPEEDHISIADFVDDLIAENSDGKNFLGLVKSIAENGFIPFDPIIIWKDGKHYYVAEGNRRVLATKLLIEPSDAPKAIRSQIQHLAALANVENLKRIGVNIAPSFEAAEWYINQRNSNSSYQLGWSRTQQQRWIYELYEKYNDILKVASLTKLSVADLENFIRYVKVRDYVKNPEIRKYLSKEDIELASSLKFPITILERFFSRAEAREKFTLVFSGGDVSYTGDKNKFLLAFSNLIERIVHRKDKYAESETRIDTRTLTSNFSDILNSLPSVKEPIAPLEPPHPPSPPPPPPPPVPPTPPPPLKNDPNRDRLIMPIYVLHTSNSRLLGLFNEMKDIPKKLENVRAAVLRIFLDIAVNEYIAAESLESGIGTTYRTELNKVLLKQKLEYIKQNKLKKGKSNKIIVRLLDPANEFSLDVLNGYVHGSEMTYISRPFINKFWDFLFPLFEDMLDIHELK